MSSKPVVASLVCLLQVESVFVRDKSHSQTTLQLLSSLLLPLLVDHILQSVTRDELSWSVRFVDRRRRQVSVSVADPTVGV